ncbi:MAG: hypothetical protein ACRDZR_01880 [Acidimicrobiales bacterium]
MPAGTRRGAAEQGGTFERRMAALEEAVAAMATEVRTRRLVVSAGPGTPRVVAEVVRDTAELRVELPPDGDGAGAATVLFASGAVPVAEPGHERAGPAGVRPPGQATGDGSADAGGSGLGPGVGLQLWAEGDAVAELDAWPDGTGRWRAQLHLEDGEGS